jgi:probable addiction module antidote protein
MSKMKKIKTSKWNPSEDIETKEDVIAYLEAAMDENDPAFLLKTIGYIARSKGMAQLARELNLNREGLSGPVNSTPSFLTVVKVLDNLGFRFKIEQKVPA